MLLYVFALIYKKNIMNNIQPKKVSIPLAIGIFVISLIFSWFTLQKGYSKTAKIVSFS